MRARSSPAATTRPGRCSDTTRSGSATACRSDSSPRSDRRGTGRGCRAVVAARLLAPGSEWRVLRALQLANFTTPLLLDDDARIRAALRDVPGIDSDAIVERMDDAEVTDAYERDKAEARSASGTPPRRSARPRRPTARSASPRRRSSSSGMVRGSSPAAGSRSSRTTCSSRTSRQGSRGIRTRRSATSARALSGWADDGRGRGPARGGRTPSRTWREPSGRFSISSREERRGAFRSGRTRSGSARDELRWRPMFVSFEGLDGSGKSTQAKLLRARLEADGEAVLTRGARRDRARRADPRARPSWWPRRTVGRGAPVRGRPRAACRAGHPARARARRGGRLRSLPRLLGRVPRGSGARTRLQRVLDLNLAAVAGLLPDRTFLLLLDPAEVSARVGGSTIGSNARTRRSTGASTPGIASSRSGSRSGSSCSTASVLPNRLQRRCMERFASVPEQLEASGSSPPRSRTRRHTPISCTALRSREANRRAGVRNRPPRGRSPGRGSHASRSVRPRAARGDDPHRRCARAPARPAHAPLRGGSTRLPRPRCRADERGRCRRAAQGSEEPPPYAVIVLVASELGPPPPTILSAASSSRSEAFGARRPGVDHATGAGAERGRNPRPLPRRRGAARSRAPPRLGRG